MSEPLVRITEREISLGVEDDLWYHDGTPFSGLVYDTDESGSVISEQEFKNGAYDGTGRGWYPNGQLWTERRFKGGLLFSVSRVWHINGQLAEEDFYEFGIRLHGKKWDEKGALKEEFIIDQGSPEYETLTFYRQHPLMGNS
jgi:antitoxin component YwqK of YwqJK toxin-antitoxin module